jgi:hypothetical protein|tara:strand:- start:20930 stop:21772 length:843 start_codon:yes stop_codon:yes gene_type:complete
MTKKQETKKVVATPPVEEQPKVVKQTKVETPVMEKPLLKKETWELKNRMYYLKGGKKPVSRSIRSSNIYYFDEEKGYERELKYCSNQRTPFVDEMKGDQRLEHIIFRDGALYVGREKTVLQKLLSLYHPHKDTLYYEHKPQLIAEDQLENINLEVDALVAARNLDVDMAEAVMRTEVGSKVSNMSSKELKRDLLIFAKRNPSLFLDLVNDENIVLRNFGIRAVEEKILVLSQDQRTISWGSNNRKLLNVPFDEHPYSALAAWFKTDEGMEIYSSIEKRLN